MASGTPQGHTTVTPIYFQNVLVAPTGNRVPVSGHPRPGPLRPARRPRLCSRPVALPALGIPRERSPPDLPAAAGPCPSAECPPRLPPWERASEGHSASAQRTLHPWTPRAHSPGRPSTGTRDLSTPRLLRLGPPPVAPTQRGRDACRERDREGGQLGPQGGSVRQGTKARAAFCQRAGSLPTPLLANACRSARPWGPTGLRCPSRDDPAGTRAWCLLSPSVPQGWVASAPPRGLSQGTSSAVDSARLGWPGLPDCRHGGHPDAAGCCRPCLARRPRTAGCRQRPSGRPHGNATRSEDSVPQTAARTPRPRRPGTGLGSADLERDPRGVEPGRLLRQRRRLGPDVREASPPGGQVQHGGGQRAAVLVTRHDEEVHDEGREEQQEEDAGQGEPVHLPAGGAGVRRARGAGRAPRGAPAERPGPGRACGKASRAPRGRRLPPFRAPMHPRPDPRLPGPAQFPLF